MKSSRVPRKTRASRKGTTSEKAKKDKEAAEKQTQQPDIDVIVLSDESDTELADVPETPAKNTTVQETPKEPATPTQNSARGRNTPTRGGKTDSLHMYELTQADVDNLFNITRRKTRNPYCFFNDTLLKELVSSGDFKLIHVRYNHQKKPHARLSVAEGVAPDDNPYYVVTYAQCSRCQQAFRFEGPKNKAKLDNLVTAHLNSHNTEEMVQGDVLEQPTDTSVTNNATENSPMSEIINSPRFQPEQSSPEISLIDSPKESVTDPSSAPNLSSSEYPVPRDKLLDEIPNPSYWGSLQPTIAPELLTSYRFLKSLNAFQIQMILWVSTGRAKTEFFSTSDFAKAFEVHSKELIGKLKIVPEADSILESYISSMVSGLDSVQNYVERLQHCVHEDIRHILNQQQSVSLSVKKWAHNGQYYIGVMVNLDGVNVPLHYQEYKQIYATDDEFSNIVYNVMKKFDILHKTVSISRDENTTRLDVSSPGSDGSFEKIPKVLCPSFMVDTVMKAIVDIFFGESASSEHAMIFKCSVAFSKCVCSIPELSQYWKMVISLDLPEIITQKWRQYSKALKLIADNLELICENFRDLLNSPRGNESLSTFVYEQRSKPGVINPRLGKRYIVLEPDETDVIERFLDHVKDSNKLLQIHSLLNQLEETVSRTENDDKNKLIHNADVYYDFLRFFQALSVVQSEKKEARAWKIELEPFHFPYPSDPKLLEFQELLRPLDSHLLKSLTQVYTNFENQYARMFCDDIFILGSFFNLADRCTVLLSTVNRSSRRYHTIRSKVENFDQRLIDILIQNYKQTDLHKYFFVSLQVHEKIDLYDPTKFQEFVKKEGDLVRNEYRVYKDKPFYSSPSGEIISLVSDHTPFSDQFWTQNGFSEKLRAVYLRYRLVTISCSKLESSLDESKDILDSGLVFMSEVSKLITTNAFMANYPPGSSLWNKVAS